MKEKHIWRIIFGLLIIGGLVNSQLTSLSYSQETKDSITEKIIPAIDSAYQGVDISSSEKQIIAENQMKSIINQAQLKPYMDCIKECKYFLPRGI